MEQVKSAPFILGEPGDPSAPRGSRPWCLALYDRAVRQKKDGKFAVQELRMALMSLRDGGHFRTLTNNKRQPFQSFEDFVQFREPYGLGMDVDVVDAIFREVDGTKSLDKLMEERRAVAEKARQQAETISPKGGGSPKKSTPAAGRTDVGRQGSNNTERILRRVARASEENPAAQKALAAYEAGEIASGREVARAAGIKDPNKRITLGDPERVAARILEEMGEEYAVALGGALVRLRERN